MHLGGSQNAEWAGDQREFCFVL